MHTFELGGKTYDLIDLDDWYLTESRDVDHWIGESGIAGSGRLSRIACQAAVSIARVDKGVTIRDWLDKQTNRVIGAIYEQVQAQVEAELAAEEAEKLALEASGVVLSPSHAGSETLPGEIVAESSVSSETDGGSRP